MSITTTKEYLITGMIILGHSIMERIRAIIETLIKKQTPDQITPRDTITQQTEIGGVVLIVENLIIISQIVGMITK